MEQAMGSEKFLENIPTVIPGPLKLSFIRIQNVLENASRVPYLTFQSIHVARSLLHLLVATAQAIPNAKVISQDDLSECIELRRNLTELALLFDDILSPGQFEVTSKIESWQERLGNIFTTLTTRTHRASVIIQSEAVFWGLRSIDRRHLRTVHLGDTLSPNEATSNPVLEGPSLVLYVGKPDDASMSSKHPLSIHDPYMSQSTASSEAFLSPIRQAYDSQATMDDLYYSVSDQGRPLVMQATARDKHGHKATSNSAPATSQSDVPMDEVEDVTVNARSLPSDYLRGPPHDVPLPHLTPISQRTNMSRSISFDSSSAKPTDQPDLIEMWRLPESLSDVASGDVNLQHEETSTSAIEGPQSDVPMDEAEDGTVSARSLPSDYLHFTPSLYLGEPLSMNSVTQYFQTGGPNTSYAHRPNNFLGEIFEDIRNGLLESGPDQRPEVPKILEKLEKLSPASAYAPPPEATQSRSETIFGDLRNLNSLETASGYVHHHDHPSIGHTIVMEWNFAKGGPVIESTLDTHSETGDSVPRYRFTKGQNGATMIFKIHNRHPSQIGHIRWLPAMHSSSIFLRSSGFYNGKDIGSVIPLHEFRRRLDGSPDAREFTLNGRTFFWIRANENLQDMVCWCRKPDNSVECAAYYEEDGGILTIYASGQNGGDVIDEIPVSCVVNLYMRDLKCW